MSLVYVREGPIKVPDLLAVSIIELANGGAVVHSVVHKPHTPQDATDVYYVGVGNVYNAEKKQFDTQSFGYHEMYTGTTFRMGTAALVWQALGKALLDVFEIDDEDDYVYQKVLSEFIKPLEQASHRRDHDATSLIACLSLYDSFHDAQQLVKSIFIQYLRCLATTCNAYAAELEMLHEAFFDRTQSEILVLKEPSATVTTFLAENDAFEEVQFIVEPCRVTSGTQGVNVGAYRVIPVPRHQHIPLLSNRLIRDFLLGRLKAINHNEVIVYDLTAAIWVARSSLYAYYAPINLVHRLYKWASNLTF